MWRIDQATDGALAPDGATGSDAEASLSQEAAPATLTAGSDIETA